MILEEYFAKQNILLAILMLGDIFHHWLIDFIFKMFENYQLK